MIAPHDIIYNVYNYYYFIFKTRLIMILQHKFFQFFIPLNISTNS